MYKPEERYNVDDVRFYRTMKKDVDGLPLVEQSKNGLGVVVDGARPDLVPDADGHVHPGKGGMSVAPHWRQLPRFLIPARLRHLEPKARGSNSVHCFRFGDGAFQRGAIGHDLVLNVDSEVHGTVEPEQAMDVETYRVRLEETRESWQIDED